MKVKKGKKEIQSKYRSAKSKQPDSRKKINPFELKFTRTKYKILGKPDKANIVGMPGLSRKKAFENRSHSLAIEYKEFGKVNKIVDHRLGERDSRISQEDRMAKRFASERQNLLRANNSQLAEDGPEEELTHRGAALTSVEKYDRTASDDDDDEGNIDADMVSVAHFGGGFDAAQPDEPGTDRSVKRKDMIAELIAKTKQQRRDKQMARDEQEGATERLDEKWKKLMRNGVIGNFAQQTVKRAVKTVSDDYDALFRELQMDNSKRGEATERQKTEEEIAAEEREKLFKLEKERLAHITDAALHGEPQQNSHNIEVDRPSCSENRPSGFVVKYDAEGNLIGREKVQKARIKVVRINNESSDEDEMVSEEIDESEEEDFERMLRDETDEESEASPKPITNEIAAKGAADSSSKQLPFVFEMPQSYEDLRLLLDGRIAQECGVVIERLIKCFHPSLREGNKRKLARLFLYLLRYYDDVSKDTVEVETLGQLIKNLFNLLKFNVEYAVRCTRALLRKQRTVCGRNQHTMFDFRVISFVTLVGRLFPVTDRFHPVCTGTLAFAANLLATVRVSCIRDAARMVLLTVVLSSYVDETKRYIPEVIAFLRGLFLMGVENGEDERCPTATFPISLPFRRMLLVENDCSQLESVFMINLRSVFGAPSLSFDDSDANRISVLRAAISVTNKFLLIYAVHTCSFSAIFSPIASLLSRLPKERYPALLAGELFDLQAAIRAHCENSASIRQLQKAKVEKKMATMLEPRFEKNFDVERWRTKKDSSVKGKKAEEKKLKSKYKKEMRGAIRELRRDNQFLEREKRRSIVENRMARRIKTRRLMSSLQGQESEYKKSLFMKQKRK